MPNLLARLALAFLLAPASLASAHLQDPSDAASLERSAARFRAYLATRPFHEQGFERLVDASVRLGTLDALVAELEAAVVAAPLDSSARILLARLHGREGRVSRALELLDGLAPAGEQGESGADANAEFAVALQSLRGALLVEGGELARGLDELDAAAAGMVALGARADARALEALHRRRAETALRLGDRERAAAAFAACASVDPASFDLALDVAARLADAGAHDAARERLEAALDIAGEDTPRRCRALSALGRLHDQRGAAGEAAAAYGEVIDLLGRGHWLRRDVEDRLLELHVHVGTTEQLASELAAAIVARPGDLGRRELLARVQLARNDPQAARATLEAASAQFPRDLELARSLLDVLDRLQDDDARIATLQRMIEHHPEELELYVDLGRVFAGSGRFDEARTHWQRSLERRLDDAGHCLRLAELHAHHGMVDVAAELIERALELEPRELGHYGELAGVLARADRRGEVAAVLDRAEAAAGDDPAALETLSLIADEAKDSARAERAIERALELEPENVRALFALADRAERSGERARASDALRRIVALGRDESLERDAARRLVRLRERDWATFEREERKRLAADPADRAALYLLAHQASERNDGDTAAEHVEAMLALDAGDVRALVLATELHERFGDGAAAAAAYRALAEHDPRQRAKWTRKLGELHARSGDSAAALACFEEALAASPGDAGAMRDVARQFAAAGHEARARACLEEALRLQPSDDEARMALADLLLTAEPAEVPDGARLAEAEVRKVIARGVRGQLDRARAWIHERLVERDEVDDEIARLRDAFVRNPYDPETPVALVDLYRREGEYELGTDLLGERIALRPRDVALRLERAELNFDLRRFDLADGDFEVALRTFGGDRETLLLKRAECALAIGDGATARSLAGEVDDPGRVATWYRHQGLDDDAVAVLERALEATPRDRILLDRLATLHAERNEHDAALAVLARLVEVAGESRESALRRASLLRARGDEEGYVGAMADALLSVEPASGPSGAAAERLSSDERRSIAQDVARERSELYDALYDHSYSQVGFELRAAIAARAAMRAPAREPLAQLAFQSLFERQDFALAAELLAACRAAAERGELPAGKSAARWDRILDSWERRLERATQATADVAPDAELPEAGELTPEIVQRLEDAYTARLDSAKLVELHSRAAARFPADERHRASLALVHVARRDAAAAATELRALLATKGLRAATDQLRARRTDRARLEKRLPPELAAAVDDEIVSRLRRLEAAVGFDGAWQRGHRPPIETAKVALARALIDAGDVEGAREILAQLEPSHPEHVERAAFVAALYSEAGLEEDAERLRRSVVDALTRCGEVPVLRAAFECGRICRPIMLEQSARLFSEGLEAEAYELSRRFGGAAAAHAAIPLLSDPASVLAQLGERFRRRLEAFGAGSAGPGELLDEGVLCLDAMLAANELAEARSVAVELAGAFEDNQPLAEVAASLCARAGDLPGALAILEAASARAIEEVRRAGAVPNEEQDDFYFFGDAPAGPARPFALDAGELPRAGVPTSFEDLHWNFSPMAVEKWVPWGLEVRALSLAWEGRDWAAAAARLERLAAANPPAVQSSSESLAALGSQLPLRAESLELFRVLHAAIDPGSGIALLYGSALEASGRGEEAQRLYAEVDRSSVADPQLRAELRRRLSGDVAAGEDAAPSAAELRAALSADPKSVRLRKSLVERLVEEQQYSAALAEWRALAASAPHLRELDALGDRVLILAGEEEEYVARRRAALAATQKPDARARLALELAALVYEVGEKDEVKALLDEARGDLSYEALHLTANFWIDRNERDEAVAELERARAAIGPDDEWTRQYIDMIGAQILRESGGSTDTAESLRARSVDEVGLAPELGRLWDWIEGELSEGNETAMAEMLEALAGESEGGRAEFLRAAAMHVRGDGREAEEAWLALGVAEPFLRDGALLAVDSARRRGDFEAAAAMLRATLEHYPPRRRLEQDTPLGRVNEVAAAAIELGALDLEASRGRPGQAEVAADVVARWSAALAGEPAARLEILHAAGLDEAARAALAELDAAGTQLDAPGVHVAARIERRSSGAAAAFERLNGSRERLASLWPESLRRLHRELALELGLPCEAPDASRAPRDPRSALAHVEAAAASEGMRAALRRATAWPAGDLEWTSCWRRLADRASGLTSLDPETRRADRALVETFLLRASEVSGEAPDAAFVRRLACEGDFGRVDEVLARATPYDAAERRRQAAAEAVALGHPGPALELIDSLPDWIEVPSTTPTRLAALVALERLDEAHALAIAIATKRQESEDDPAVLGRHRADLRAAPRHAAALAAARLASGSGELAGDDALEALRELAVLEWIEADGSSAELVAALTELERMRPLDPLVLAWHVETLAAAGELEAALGACERSLVALDRRIGAGAVGEFDGGVEVSRLRRLRGSLALRMHGPAAAHAAWRDRVGLRFQTARRAAAYTWFRDVSPSRTAFAHGMVREASGAADDMTEPELEMLTGDDPWLALALARSGDVEAALERARRSLHLGSSAVAASVRVFAETDRLGELDLELARLGREVGRGTAEARATKELVLEAKFLIAEQRGDDAALARAARELAALRPDDPRALEQLAAALLRAGEHEEALERASRAASLRDRQVLDGRFVADVEDPEAVGADVSELEWEPGGPVRFEFADAHPWDGSQPWGEEYGVFDLGGSEPFDGTDWTASSNEREVPGARSLCPAIARVLGASEADAWERERLAELASKGARGALAPRVVLAAEYASFGAPELDRHAERMLLAEREDLGEVFGQRWARDAAALVAERLADLAVRRGDGAAAARWREEARQLAPLRRGAPGALERGLLALDAGDAEAALTLLAAAEEEAKLAGRWDRLGADLQHGLGAARAAVHGRAAARAELLRAIAEFPSHWRAARSRELLGAE